MHWNNNNNSNKSNIIQYIRIKVAIFIVCARPLESAARRGDRARAGWALFCFTGKKGDPGPERTRQRRRNARAGPLCRVCIPVTVTTHSHRSQASPFIPLEEQQQHKLQTLLCVMCVYYIDSACVCVCCYTISFAADIYTLVLRNWYYSLCTNNKKIALMSFWKKKNIRDWLSFSSISHHKATIYYYWLYDHKYRFDAFGGYIVVAARRFD